MAYRSSEPPFPAQSDPVDFESDVEDEVDQLDSDTDVEGTGPNATSSSTKKVTSGLAGVRVPGQSLLPAVRLENIIQADGVMGNLALSREGLFVLSAATEEFIKRMTQAGHRSASAHHRATVTYGDMASATQQYQEFKFLEDTIPQPVPLIDALGWREEKERLEEDPALATPAPIPSPAPPVMASIAGPSTANEPPSKAKGKNRANNGKEKVNGSASTSRRESSRSNNRGPRTKESSVSTNGAWSEPSDEQIESRASSHHRRSARNTNGTASSVPSSRSSSRVNGHSVTPRSGTITPALPREGRMDPPSPRHSTPRSRTPPSYAHDEPPWSGQFTGPASGFLQGPGTPFGRPAPNPGRTIYSQSHRSD
ncbi:hypothetical protein BDQ12DRAFT_679806 [Crucibulum laeve]|uniref:Transcription factor CBF/NF-Y/archaeal histone domain-containing protein n=1 Tax=Crucibulum laeve TaxID=68775 RepID=A0A5C3M706_9AGAR|nr:hypothetical protein BDQ12DRAFT_679806 [Crucibulum laeve]